MIRKLNKIKIKMIASELYKNRNKNVLKNKLYLKKIKIFELKNQCPVAAMIRFYLSKKSKKIYRNKLIPSSYQPSEFFHMKYA